MKKALLIVGMIMAVMMVVQPTYAANQGTFNITVTISSFSMELMKHDGMAMYNDWAITVPPGGAITMVANDAVMVSLTGDIGTNGVDVVTFVQNSHSWHAVMPDPGNPLQNNDFVLLADLMLAEPADNGQPLSLANPRPITDVTEMPLGMIPGGQDKAWVIYSLQFGTQYDNPQENIEVVIEAKLKP